jgi:Na+-transporting NADH:ubiquinone oxidoreductase subunit A
MLNDIKIKNGLTIKLKGAAENILKKAALPESVSLNPSDFHLIIPKMALKVGEKVSQGSVVFFKKRRKNKILFAC